MLTRTIRHILARPLTDAEEATADRHIAREAARIRATWSPLEAEKRRGGITPVVTAPQYPDATFCLEVEADETGWREGWQQVA